MTLRKYIIAVLVSIISVNLIQYQKPNHSTLVNVRPIPVEASEQIKPIVEPQEQSGLAYYIPKSIGSTWSYAWGNCTWYVASKRYVPAGLGHASQWYANAQARGMAVGDKPSVGAIAWAIPNDYYGHVAFVEEVYPDGSFLVSEMNVVGFNKVSKRVLTTGYKFIY